MLALAGISAWSLTAYHYEYRGGVLEVSERVGAEDPPVSQPVEDQAQEAATAEDASQGENCLAGVSPVAPDLYTSPLPSSV